MSCPRVALEQSEGVLNGVDEGPVEVEQFEPCASRKNDAGHRSARAATLGKLAAELLKRDGLTA